MIKICFLAGFYLGQLLMIVPLPWTTAHYCHRIEIVLRKKNTQNKQLGFSLKTTYPFQETFLGHKLLECGPRPPKSLPSSTIFLNQYDESSPSNMAKHRKDTFWPTRNSWRPFVCSIGDPQTPHLDPQRCSWTPFAWPLTNPQSSGSRFGEHNYVFSSCPNKRRYFPKTSRFLILPQR